MSRYRVVAAESPVQIDARSSMHPIHAITRELSGDIEVTLDAQGWPDLTKPYSATLSLPVESIRSGNNLQDREMRRRLDSRRNPTIEVSVAEAQPAATGGRYRATARIAANGQAQSVTGEVRMRSEGDRIVIEGEQVIDMRSFGVEPPRLLILKVEPEVTVHVHVTAVEQH